MEFEKVKRQAIIIWLYNIKYLKNIRKFGQVHFVSKKLRYVVMYVSKKELEETVQKIERLHFVQKVEVSYRDEIDMTWKDAIPNRKDKDAIKNQAEDATGMNQGYVADPFLKNLEDSLKSKEQR